MILLDSDHVSVLLDPRHAKRAALVSRLQSADDELGLPIVVVEEQMRGWLAAIHGSRDVYKQIVPYVRLAKLVDFLGGWTIVLWNEAAADEFTALRKSRIRVGTQDLKIASIALASQALVLSANLRDFEQVPGLRVEDWL